MVGNTTALEELIAGLGVQGARNLHIRDENHEDDVEYGIMTSARMRTALLAGNFGVFATERDLSNAERTSIEGADRRIQILAPDNRTEFISRSIRNDPEHGATDAISFEANANSYCKLWYHHRITAFANAAAVERYASEQGITLPANGAEIFLRIVDDIERGSSSPEANREVVARQRHARDPQRGGAVHIWGNFHTNTNDASIDMDRVFEGPVISIVQNDQERELQSRIDDPAEYYFVVATGRIVNARGQEMPDVEAIREAGRNAINSGRSTVPTTAAPAPVYTAPASTPETSTTPEQPAADTTNNEGFDWRSLPIGAVIGGGLFAWIFSQMGIIGTLLGGILGAWLGGEMDKNMRAEHAASEAEHPPATATSLAVSEESPDVRAIALANAPSQQRLAFAQVDSVEQLAAPRISVPAVTDISAQQFLQ